MENTWLCQVYPRVKSVFHSYRTSFKPKPNYPLFKVIVVRVLVCFVYITLLESESVHHIYSQRIQSSLKRWQFEWLYNLNGCTVYSVVILTVRLICCINILWHINYTVSYICLLRTIGSCRVLWTSTFHAVFTVSEMLLVCHFAV